MNPFEMVVVIVLIVSVANVLRARYRGEARRGRTRDQDSGESDALRAEVRQLKDRIQVLEAIVTDGDRNRGLALEREIEQLRDRRDPQEA
jgi:hypothetical protein